MADMIVRKAEEKDIPSLIELVKGYLEFYKRPIPDWLVLLPLWQSGVPLD